MAIGIDTSDRKPRRMKGTPSYAIRNKFALAVVSAGVGIGLILNYLPASLKFRKILIDYINEVDADSFDRREMPPLLPSREGVSLRQGMIDHGLLIHPNVESKSGKQ